MVNLSRGWMGKCGTLNPLELPSIAKWCAESRNTTPACGFTIAWRAMRSGHKPWGIGQGRGEGYLACWTWLPGNAAVSAHPVNETTGLTTWTPIWAGDTTDGVCILSILLILSNSFSIKKGLPGNGWFSLQAHSDCSSASDYSFS